MISSMKRLNFFFVKSKIIKLNHAKQIITSRSIIDLPLFFFCEILWFPTLSHPFSLWQLLAMESIFGDDFFVFERQRGLRSFQVWK